MRGPVGKQTAERSLDANSPELRSSSFSLSAPQAATNGLNSGLADSNTTCLIELEYEVSLLIPTRIDLDPVLD